MKGTMIAAFILAGVLAGAGCMTERYAQHHRGHFSKADTLAVMTKEDVIALSKAKVSDDVTISQIKATASCFQLSAQDIIDLSNAGVSDKVIDAMIKTDEPSRHAEASAGYYSYPPYYWDDPFWYPWYPSFYLGFSTGYHRPFYYGYHGFYGGHGFGGFRSGGHRR